MSALDVDHFFLIGSDVPAAPRNRLRRGFDGVDAVFAGSFLPFPGVTVVRVLFDLSSVRPRPRDDRDSVGVADDPGPIVWEAVA